MNPWYIIAIIVYALGVIAGIVLSAYERANSPHLNSDDVEEKVEKVYVASLIICWPIFLALLTAAALVIFPISKLDKAHQKLGEYLVRLFKIKG